MVSGIWDVFDIIKDGPGNVFYRRLGTGWIILNTQRKDGNTDTDLSENNKTTGYFHILQDPCDRGVLRQSDEKLDCARNRKILPRVPGTCREVVTGYHIY